MNAAATMPPKVYTDGPGKLARVMIWDDGKPEQIELRWGMRPIEPGAKPLSLLRAEGRIITNRCLVIANDFYLRKGTAGGDKRRRVELITNAPFFCFAGTWRPEQSDWPASFAGLTVEAYPDIAPFQDRHMAVVRAEDWWWWLSARRTKEEIIRPFPAGSFRVVGPSEKAAKAPPPPKAVPQVGGRAAKAVGDLFG